MATRPSPWSRKSSRKPVQPTHWSSWTSTCRSATGSSPSTSFRPSSGRWASKATRSTSSRMCAFWLRTLSQCRWELRVLKESVASCRSRSLNLGFSNCFWVLKCLKISKMVSEREITSFMSYGLWCLEIRAFYAKKFKKGLAAKIFTISLTFSTNFNLISNLKI